MYDRETSSSDKCNTTDEDRKKKKLKSVDNFSVCDSGLGMEPHMDEVNFEKSNSDYVDNFESCSSSSSNRIKKIKEICALN